MKLEKDKLISNALLRFETTASQSQRPNFALFDPLCKKLGEGLAKFLSRYLEQSSLAGVRMWITRRYGYTRTALKRQLRN